MEVQLRARLLDQTAAGKRVYWETRPQGTALPAIVLTIVSDARSQHMAGFDGYQARRVQVDCYAGTYAEAAAMREAVIAAIVPGAVQGAVTFLRGFVNNALSRGEVTDTGFVFRQMVDLTIWHN